MRPAEDPSHAVPPSAASGEMEASLPSPSSPGSADRAEHACESRRRRTSWGWPPTCWGLAILGSSPAAVAVARHNSRGGACVSITRRAAARPRGPGRCAEWRTIGRMVKARVFPWRRLAVTVLPPLAVALIARWPIPGRHLETLERVGATFDPTLFGLFSLGLNQVIAAFLLVEVAALIVPRWRPLRHGGPAGRARLRRWVTPIALVLMGIQSFFIFRWMQSSSDLVPGMSITPDTTAGWMMVIAGPIVGSLFLLWLAELISKHGLANGFSVLIAGTAIPELVAHVAPSVRVRFADGLGHRELVVPAALTMVGLVALAVRTARRPADGWLQRPRRPGLPVPLSALLPVIVCSSLLALPKQLEAFISGAGLEAVVKMVQPGTASEAGIRVGVLLVLGPAFAWLLARPRLVAPVWQAALRAHIVPTERNGDHASHHRDQDGDALALARAAHRRALWQTVAFLAALSLVGWLDAWTMILIDVVTPLVILCVAFDVAAEVRFRQVHPDAVAVTAEHRLYAVGPALAALTFAGIAGFPRALRHRALLAFWGPYLPVEILVPRSRADDARAVLAGWLSPNDATSPKPVRGGDHPLLVHAAAVGRDGTGSVSGGAHVDEFALDKQ